MNPDHPGVTPRHADEQYRMPTTEALIAGTLALMTGHAQACDLHREAMSRKIAAHLSALMAAEGLSPHFRAMLGKLQLRWGAATNEAAPDDMLTAEQQRRSLWMPASETVQ